MLRHQHEIDFIAVLNWSKVFSPHGQTICGTNSDWNILCYYGNQHSVCRDVSLHKAAAQLEPSEREGKSFDKTSPITSGEQKKLLRFVPTPTHTAVSNVQRNDWCALGDSSGGISMVIHLHWRRWWHVRTSEAFCSHVLPWKRRGGLVIRSFQPSLQ